MSSGQRTLREDLARYIDNEAYHTQSKDPVIKTRMFNRRKAAQKRADAALRFFSEPARFNRLRQYIASGDYEQLPNPHERSED